MDLRAFQGANAGYALELYERYIQNPLSVDPATRAILETWTPNGQMSTREATSEGSLPVSHLIAASTLAHAIRERGHLAAQLDPLGSKPVGDPSLSAEAHGIREEDLLPLPAEAVGGHSATIAHNAQEAIEILRNVYSGTISYEFNHVKSAAERIWLLDAAWGERSRRKPESATRRELLKRLTQVEVFERYLQQVFPGQTRFSLEGIDMFIPMLDEIVRSAVESQTREVIIGMAHRGRLNVLAHTLGKPYSQIFSEFAHGKDDPRIILRDTAGWSGDVKYHLGGEHILGEDAFVDVSTRLVPNPSHLEFVNPVVAGVARALQETCNIPGVPQQDGDRALPILIHGDAAFMGEGVVAEMLNMWRLRGYWVGGTIHIILNNQLGFTTDPIDSRSTNFASDLAKGFAIPIIHVNADDPEACLTAVRIANAYRDQFHQDVLVDLVGYRRRGHNEGDEPSFTQPKMYEIIDAHPTVRELYARSLEQDGIVSQEESEAMVKDANAVLEEAQRQADSDQYYVDLNDMNALIEFNNHREEEDEPRPVPTKRLRTFNKELLTWPDGFAPNAKLARLLQRRMTTLDTKGGIDWGQAEALAFASILAEGTPIRLTGQDSERGTFSHRHAVLHDERTGATYAPLQHLSNAKASFSIFNSPLSEVGVLGFEYGYSVYTPQALVLWEAQFGDFVNVAQVMIDQFIASARAKWRQDSSLVLLLPHGFEGKGPEHSSARLERFLQLSAGDNWRIAYCSTAAQYFHLLRLQAFYLTRKPRPLVVMTPKSLLRHPLSMVTLHDLSHGSFQTVIDDQFAISEANEVRRVIVCTGKMAIDLLSHQDRPQAKDVAIVRVEMLYPFPRSELIRAFENYPNAREVIWVQEEPQNMGAWSYMAPQLSELMRPNVQVDVIARSDRSSPATGFLDLHPFHQEQIITQALHPSIMEHGGKHAY